MNFSETYDSLTDQINSVVSTQITQSMWESIPGGLDKVSTSSMGFAWGIGSGDVFMCQLPCSGQWKKVDSGAIDIITDDTHVYVLTPTSLKIKSASNTDDWVVISSPGLTSILVTSSYVWGQVSGKTYRLAKPGTTGNWILVANSNTLTSSSANTLYAVDATGKALKTDEAMQSSWAPISDFVGQKISKVIGDLDQTAMYGLDTTNQLKRCVSGNCMPVETDGFVPKSVTADPSTKTLWMTTQTPGDKGNIFTRLDSANDVIPAIQPIDKQRDDVVEASKLAHNHSTQSGMFSKQIAFVLEFIKKHFKLPKNTNYDHKKLTDTVENVHSEVDSLTRALPAIQRIAIYVVIAAGIYLFSSILGFLSHILAIGVLGYGIYDVYFLQPKL